MPDLSLWAVLGVGAIALAAGLAIGWRLHARQTDPGLTFTEVADAGLRAKEERRADHRLSREYIDGVDGLLAELMDRGYGTTQEEMSAAFQAGGDPDEGREMSLEDSRP